MNIASLLLVAVFVVLSVAIVSAGSEDIIRDGLSENAGGVFVLPAGNYVVSDTIVIPANTVLKGEVSDDGKLLTRIELTRNAQLGHQVPVIRMSTNCKILYIDFYGNEGDQPSVPMRKGNRWGNGYHNFIGANYVNNIEVAHCNFYSNLGDGLRATRCKGVSFHDNTAGKGGHDVLYAIKSENVLVYNNYVEPRVNSAFRFMDVNHGRIYNNTVVFKRYIDGKRSSAGPAIQIQNDAGIMKDIEICGNYIYDSWGPAFWIVGKTASHDQEVWIHHNVMYNAGGNSNIYWVGGIIASGYNNILLEHNVFDGSYLGAVNFWAYSRSWGTKAVATLRNNIFTNSRENAKDGIGGWGVNNEIPAQSVVSKSNCYYNNDAGDTRGCSTSGTDYHTNPKSKSTTCDVKWDGEKWNIPGVEPQSMGAYDGVYDDMTAPTEEELEEFEFENIFSMLELNFYSGSGKTPDGYKSTDSCNVTVYDNEYMPQSRYSVETDNYTSKVVYEYGNSSSTHYLMTKYSASGLSGYENLDMWEMEGNATRAGDSFVIPEVVLHSPDPVSITIYDTAGRATHIKTFDRTVYKEDLKDAINPIAYMFVAIILILCMGIALNLKIIYNKRRYL